MTCPSLLRRSSSAVAATDQPAPPTAPRPSHLRGELLAALRRDDLLAQFSRFLLVGVVTTAVYAVLFLALSQLGGLDYLPAHVAAIITSTALANELHRRLTFHAEERVSWLTAQWEAGSVTLIGLVATSAALRWLDAVTETAHPVLQVGVVALVTAVIGALRFIALRWIFRSRTPAPA